MKIYEGKFLGIFKTCVAIIISSSLKIDNKRFNGPKDEPKFNGMFIAWVNYNFCSKLQENQPNQFSGCFLGKFCWLEYHKLTKQKYIAFKTSKPFVSFYIKNYQGSFLIDDANWWLKK